VTEVSDGKHGDARTAVGRIQQPRGIERLTLEPLVEPGRGEDRIEFHREIEALAFGKEGLEIHDADLLERRRLNLPDYRREIEILAGTPRGRQHAGDDRVLAASRRSLDASQR